jgi:hypothetical protein
MKSLMVLTSHDQLGSTGRIGLKSSPLPTLLFGMRGEVCV